MSKKPAIYVENAYCYGKGSDKFKGVSGISKNIRDAINSDFAVLVVLVDSHTEYMGQKYKKAIYQNKRWYHRQIKDADYEIKYRIHEDENKNVHVVPVK